MKVMRWVLSLALLALSLDVQATKLYGGSLCGPLGGWDTTASLNASQPASSFPCAIVWSQDGGEFYSDGTNWISMKPLGGDTSNVDFQSGLLTSVIGTKGTYYQIVKANTVDNMVASATALACVTNPTIALLECGTSTTCASPTTIASVTVTGTGAATSATVSNPSITAGDYVAWQLTGGVCTSLNLSATAQMHQ